MLLRLLTNFVCCEFKKIKTNLTMFLIFFWIIWFSQIIAISTVFMSLPNIITDIPAVTVTELPLEVLQPMQSSLNAIIVDASKKKSEENDAENRTIEILENNDEEVPPDDKIVKINDSGGGGGGSGDDTPPITSETLPVQEATENLTNTMDTGSASSELPQQDSKQENITTDGVASSAGSEGSGGSGSATATVNLTNEEVPMPVFSEWAQKQMEAAEKQQQAKDQEVVNTQNAQKKNLTNGQKKLPKNALKMRAKNYASPDCGAKIIASNSDASNTGNVLSSSKDEYMLSPCGNRIWFIVELCEAIQAQKVDLANFELFSSSPKNFTVAVANRFPTRDWSNVGRFVAEDKRNVQSFDLHPHLFGKFVRVDIHSHYSQEHFCPVSLFRVFGTSEIEAFETENHPDDDLDDFDDEFDSGGVAIDQQQQQLNQKKNSENIFKSASDAVLSIVKKAAEVLVKPTNIQNQTLNSLLKRDDASSSTTASSLQNLCRTSINGPFNCNQCKPHLVERINNILSCKFQQLDNLLNVQRLRYDLLNTQICPKQFGVDVKMALTGNNNNVDDDDDGCGGDGGLLKMTTATTTEPTNPHSFYINLLPEEYIGALCHTLSTVDINNNLDSTLALQKNNEIALNLTIEKKLKSGNLKTLNSGETKKKIIKTTNKENELPSPSPPSPSIPENIYFTTEIPPIISFTTETSQPAIEQLSRPLETGHEDEVTTTTTTTTATTSLPIEEVKPTQPTIIPDINIFNLPANEKGFEMEFEKPPTIMESNENTATTTTTSSETSGEQFVTEMPPILSSTTEIPSTKSSEEVDVGGNGGAAWDNLDTLLPTTMSPGQAQNSQQKLPGSPQSESVFIRLSNRIKTLERNMSLSGQYLEELSRRYKKQVEELQQILTQQTQNVRNLEEQNRRHLEMQQLYEQNNLLLKNELDNMALQVHACIIVIIVVGAFVLLLIVISTLFYRAIWHRSKALQKTLNASCGGGGNGGSGNSPNKTTNQCNQKKLPRRKSFDDLSDQCTEKMRRPSEEAMDILKKHLDIPEHHLQYQLDKMVQTQPQRKISICYGSPNQNNSTEFGYLVNQDVPLKTKNSTKRKFAKNSWSNPNDTRQIDLERLEQLRGMDLTLKEYQQLTEGGVGDKMPKIKNKATANVLPNQNGQNNKSKKKSQNLRRPESAPAAQYLNVSKPKRINTNQIDKYGEQLLLDEEDLDNFIPNTDLAYNEFMPEGPSGYQTVIDEENDEQKFMPSLANNINTNNSNSNIKEREKSSKNKKQRSRLPSTGFFKSPFSIGLKGKSSSSISGGGSNQNNTTTGITTTTSGGSGGNINNTPHSRATSWEWHRLRNSSFAASSPSSIGLLQHHRQHSPTGSLDASTLSEIHFPTNSTNNSFRILEEAILSSGEAIDRSPTTATSAAAAAIVNSNGNRTHSTASSVSGGSGISNSSQRSSISNSHSTTSSTNATTTTTSAKKKQRGFNRIFRKVF